MIIEDRKNCIFFSEKFNINFNIKIVLFIIPQQIQFLKSSLQFILIGSFSFLIHIMCLFAIKMCFSVLTLIAINFNIHLMNVLFVAIIFISRTKLKLRKYGMQQPHEFHYQLEHTF